MKPKSIYWVAAIAAALTLGMMAGCSGHATSQTSTSKESPSSTASLSASAKASSSGALDASAKSQDELIANLKQSVANVPAYKSVTVTEKTMHWPNSGAIYADANSSASSAPDKSVSSETPSADKDASQNDTIESVSFYKFDESGDRPKTSALFEFEDVKLQYYTDGDNAVCVTDGPVYSGTVEQFNLEHAAGINTYLKDTIGDLNSLIDCTTFVTQDVIDGVTGYELTLDPKKYIESDEILTLMADSGDPVKEAYVTVGFNADGRIVWMTKTDVFSDMTTSRLLDLTDFDSTVIEPAPAATKTYEEMEADMQAKLDALDDEVGLDSAL